MADFLRLLGFLLAPVLALLFLNLRLARRLRYPHDFLDAESRKGAAAFLFRSFRAYYDVLLDALIALALAFALAPADPFAPKGTVAVIDGSRSMLAGIPGNRPLDLAVKRLRSDPELAKAEAYLLAFDPRSASSRLSPIKRLLAEAPAESAAKRLEQSYPFFTVDYAELGSLARAGRRNIVLLTDRLAARPEGFRAIELGWAGAGGAGGDEEFGVYPSDIRYDRSSGAYLASFAEVGGRGSLSLSLWDEEGGGFARLKAPRYLVEQGPAGRTLRLPGPGLYLASFGDAYGAAGADFPFRLPPAKLQVTAEGEFSHRMLGAFPLLEEGLKPSLFLVDAEYKSMARNAQAGGLGAIVTALLPGEGSHLPDPALTGGRPLLLGRSPGADLGLGKAALANENLPLLYDGIIQAGLPPAFVTAAPPGSAGLRSAGSSYLVPTGRGGRELLPLIPPASEYFAAQVVGTIRLPPPSRARWPWVLMLGAAAALKLLLWRRFSGKSLLRREA